jgi:hypothetical protein
MGEAFVTIPCLQIDSPKQKEIRLEEQWGGIGTTPSLPACGLAFSYSTAAQRHH